MSAPKAERLRRWKPGSAAAPPRSAGARNFPGRSSPTGSRRGRARGSSSAAPSRRSRCSRSPESCARPEPLLRRCRALLFVMQRSALADVFATLKVQLKAEEFGMKKVMLGLAAAGFGALLSLGAAQAQDTKTGTGTGADAGMKNAPTSAAMGKHGMGGMKMHRHKHKRHHRHMGAASICRRLEFRAFGSAQRSARLSVINP